MQFLRKRVREWAGGGNARRVGSVCPKGQLSLSNEESSRRDARSSPEAHLKNVKKRKRGQPRPYEYGVQH
jgi:hypothetical protein